MRLIDGDALIEKFNEKVDMAECIIDARTAERFATFCALADAVEEMPTVDAVEVVRCRYCAKDGLFTCPICFIENKTLHFINHSPDFYCGEGERKDGDDDG